MKTTEIHGGESSADRSAMLDFSAGIKCARLLLISTLMLTLAGCGLGLGQARSGKSYVIDGKRYHILASAKGFREKGQASWYGEPFHGRKTASGEVYDMHKISAAHKTLPLHTWVEVRNLDNNKVMAVRVNDRGPFVKGRIIDLSRAAANELGMLNAGLARVRIRAITGEQAKRLAEAERQSVSVAALAAAPSAAPSAGDSPGYVVQALVTGSSAEAERQRKIVEKAFGRANINTTIGNGRTAFSVFIEGLKNKDEAAAAQKALVNQGYAQARIIELPR